MSEHGLLHQYKSLHRETGIYHCFAITFHVRLSWSMKKFRAPPWKNDTGGQTRRCVIVKIARCSAIERYTRVSRKAFVILALLHMTDMFSWFWCWDNGPCNCNRRALDTDIIRSGGTGLPEVRLSMNKDRPS